MWYKTHKEQQLYKSYPTKLELGWVVICHNRLRWGDRKERKERQATGEQQQQTNTNRQAGWASSCSQERKMQYCPIQKQETAHSAFMLINKCKLWKSEWVWRKVSVQPRGRNQDHAGDLWSWGGWSADKDVHSAPTPTSYIKLNWNVCEIYTDYRQTLLLRCMFFYFSE